MKIAFVFVLFALAAHADVFTTFEVCGASRSEQNGTFVNGVNGSGTVVGSAYMTTGQTVGYMRTVDGTVTCISVAGRTWTSAQSVNNAGIVTGSYSDDAENYNSAFIRNADGSLTSFRVLTFTNPAGINESGVVAGTAIPTFGTINGFIRATDGTITLLADSTSVTGINDEGSVTGSLTGAYGFSTGFVRSPDGTFREFDVPGGCTGLAPTFPAAINQPGEITGHYQDCGTLESHGFVRTKDGVLTTFDLPGSVNTFPLAINSQGDITGYFINGSGERIGFIRSGGGTNAIATFGVPGSTYNTPVAINGTLIAGSYQGLDLIYHGFIVSK